MAWTERYVRADAAGGGDGTTNTNSGANGAWTLAEGVTNEAAGQRLNIKSGTYANTTTSRTFAAAGTTTAPIWLRGFNATIGDCDADPTLASPDITFTTGGLVISGANHILSSLDASASARTSATIALSGGNTKMFRCRGIATNANAGASAILVATTAAAAIEACYFEATTTATRCVNVTTSNVLFSRCVMSGGISNFEATQAVNLLECILRNAVTDAVLQVTNGVSLFMRHCTIRNPGRDGVRVGGAAAVVGWSEIHDCIFAVVGGIGINNVAAAGNTNLVYRTGNVFFQVTTSNEAGFGDSPAFGELTAGSDPHTSTTDLSLVSGATGRNVASVFENFTGTTSYTDAGAVTPNSAAGGGGPLIDGRLVR